MLLPLAPLATIPHDPAGDKGHYYMVAGDPSDDERRTHRLRREVGEGESHDDDVVTGKRPLQGQTGSPSANE